MTNTVDPTPHWTRELATLRSRAVKRRRGSAEPPDGDITEAALAACDALLRDLAGAHLECERLRNEVRSSAAAWERLFDVTPGACLLTDSTGYILNANRAAGVLLNLSARHLKDRQLLVFSENRDAFGALLQRLARGGDQFQARLALRPRERKPVEIDVNVVPVSVDEFAGWLWFLTPSGEPQKAVRDDVRPGSAISAAG